MGESDPTHEPPAGGWQCFAHVAQEQQLGGRDTIRVGRDSALADINLTIGKEFAKMVVGPAVAEAEFQDIAIQSANQSGPPLKAGALRLEAADKAVQPAHCRSGSNAGSFPQPFHFG